MRKKLKQAWTNTKALARYAVGTGDYGTKENLKVSTKDRVKVMKFFHDSPLNIARKSFKILYKHYTK